ncbi:hypothetical protein KM043_001119 [Ampulex compressa]|nr:hypothetical protein KM043_001119 [Ampulex compressa]
MDSRLERRGEANLSDFYSSIECKRLLVPAAAARGASSGGCHDGPSAGRSRGRGKGGVKKWHRLEGPLEAREDRLERGGGSSGRKIEGFEEENRRGSRREEKLDSS